MVGGRPTRGHGRLAPGLSVVRSFTALALLDVDRSAALIAMAIGAVVAVGVWPACWGWIGRRFRRSWPDQDNLPAGATPTSSPPPAEPITVVVPIIVSLDNSPQSPVTTPNPPVAETLVPVISGLRRGATLQNPAALLERTVNATADWLYCAPPGDCAGLPGEVRAAVAAGFATRGIQVAPASAPRIAAPLGWAMSAASRDAMQTALGEVLHDCRTNCDFSRLVDGLGQAGGRGP